MKSAAPPNTAATGCGLGPQPVHPAHDSPLQPPGDGAALDARAPLPDVAGRRAGRRAADLILAGIDRARDAVVKRAVEHKRTPIIGRSHGIHAEPTTFGWKLLAWADELSRARERVERARAAIAHGKLSGAVGTFAHLSPKIEEAAMKSLGVLPDPVSTQIVQRDRHAEYFGALALVGASIEKFAVEIRHLQRTEVREAEEA